MYMHKYYHIIMKLYLIIINKFNYGKSSSTGRAPICGFGWFGSSPKFYPIYRHKDTMYFYTKIIYIRDKE